MTAITLRMRSGCEGGGKGALLSFEKSLTLATNNDQTIFIMKEEVMILMNQGGSQMSVEKDKVGTLRAQEHGHQPIVFNNHPSDSRITEGTVCQTLTSKMGTGGGNVPLTVYGKVSRPRGKDGLGERWDKVEVDSTRNCMDVGEKRSQELVTIPINTMTCQGRPSDNGRMGSGIGKEGDPCPTLSTEHHHAVASVGQVRRLTPIECERLQGFPDNFTRIPYRGKPEEQCPDAPRYKAIGNSWAVPVVRWIGKRIEMNLKGAI